MYVLCTWSTLHTVIRTSVRLFFFDGYCTWHICTYTYCTCTESFFCVRFVFCILFLSDWWLDCCYQRFAIKCHFTYWWTEDCNSTLHNYVLNECPAKWCAIISFCQDKLAQAQGQLNELKELQREKNKVLYSKNNYNTSTMLYTCMVLVMQLQMEFLMLLHMYCRRFKSKKRCVKICKLNYLPVCFKRKNLNI